MNFLHNPLVQGAISGLLSAAAVDYHAFVGWKNVQEATQYNWGTALFRWGQGAIVGLISAAGISAFL